jgi:uncharacterized membrane protein required for colicin V production
MIHIEFYWLTLVFIFAIIGAARGLGKEMGVTTIVALSLFALWLGWWRAGDLIVAGFQRGPLADLCALEVKAIYYSVAIVFIAFISYEGIVLAFPVKLKGFLKNVFGFFGGLLNGYLIVGTVWNVLADATYFYPKIAVVKPPFSNFHNSVIQFLPVSLMDNVSPIPMMVLGMLLLLAMVFK